MENIIVKTLRGRYASRSISSRPLPNSVIEDLVEAVRLTPSCYNNQPWRFLFLNTPEGLASAKEFIVPFNFAWASKAPLIVVGYAKKDDDCVLNDGRAYYQFDLGMSVMNLMLAATSHDLVARPMAGYKPEKIIELFNLQQGYEPLIVLAIGYYESDEIALPEKLRGANDKPRVRKEGVEIIRFI